MALMKKRRLPETDMARIALMPTKEAKIAALRRFKSGHPDITLAPFREQVAYTARATEGASDHMFPGPVADLDHVLSAVKAASRTPKEYEANAIRAEVLRAKAESFHWTGIIRDFGPLKLHASYSAQYWADAIFRGPLGPFLLIVDPRLANSLGPLARCFAASCAHERIRALEPELENVPIRFAKLLARKNKPLALRCSDYFGPLVPFDVLSASVAETVGLWDMVQEERADAVAVREAESEYWFGRDVKKFRG
jgi:hypothetical protein